MTDDATTQRPNGPSASAASATSAELGDSDKVCADGASGAVRDKSLARRCGSQSLPAPVPPLSQSALECVGNTPLVRLRNIERTAKLQCELYAKLEFMNIGGSVKDRIGVRMVEDAEREGRIQPGDTLIEPTSGNTGIGIALAGAVKGYRVVIVLPEKMSEEKVNILKLLGAEIVRTPTAAAWDSPESHLSVAKRLSAEIPRAHILDQYANPSNPAAHYDGTASEVLEQLAGGHVDVFVAGVGTGGTISGCARRFRDADSHAQQEQQQHGAGARGADGSAVAGVNGSAHPHPHRCTVVVGVDPVGSILAQPAELNRGGVHPYMVEGIGYDFIPTVLDRSLVDLWVKTDDRESFLAARRLIREEGLLVGGSCGSALAGALKAIERLGGCAGQRVMTILPDSARNYMSKYVSDSWMERHGFIEPPLSLEAWERMPVSRLPLQTPVTIVPTIRCGDAVNILTENAVDQLPVVEDGAIRGVVTEGNLMAQLVAKRVSNSDPVSEAMFQQYATVTPQTTLGELSRMFKYDHFALVASRQREYRHDGQAVEKTTVQSVCTPIDLLNFLVSEQQGDGSGGMFARSPSSCEGAAA